MSVTNEYNRTEKVNDMEKTLLLFFVFAIFPVVSFSAPSREMIDEEKYREIFRLKEKEAKKDREEAGRIARGELYKQADDGVGAICASVCILIIAIPIILGIINNNKTISTNHDFSTKSIHMDKHIFDKAVDSEILDKGLSGILSNYMALIDKNNRPTGCNYFIYRNCLFGRMPNEDNSDIWIVRKDGQWFDCSDMVYAYAIVEEGFPVSDSDVERIIEINNDRT
jgi:hypothetical protein